MPGHHGASGQHSLGHAGGEQAERGHCDEKLSENIEYSCIEL